MLRFVGWQLVTDVSGQPIFPIFKGKAVQEQTSVSNYQSTPRNTPDLIYTAAEAWNNTLMRFLPRPSLQLTVSSPVLASNPAPPPRGPRPYPLTYQYLFYVLSLTVAVNNLAT
jgi:hypothetical protein